MILNIDPDVCYSGKPQKLSEACSMLIRKIIEEELIRLEVYDSALGPYDWLSYKTGKHSHTIRKWAFPWHSPSGARPSLQYFLFLAWISKSYHFIEFFEQIIDTPHIRDLHYRKKLDTFASELEKQIKEFRKMFTINERFKKQ